MLIFYRMTAGNGLISTTIFWIPWESSTESFGAHSEQQGSATIEAVENTSTEYQ